MEQEIKTKWKCKDCNKILVSKQSATKHVKTFHSGSDPNQTIVEVKTSTSDTQSKPVKKVQKKAYGHFSQLTNVFNNNTLVERFSWSKNARKTEENSPVVPGKEQSVMMTRNEQSVMTGN